MQPWPSLTCVHGIQKELGFLSLSVASQGPEMLELDFVPCLPCLHQKSRHHVAWPSHEPPSCRAEVSRRDSKAHDRRKRVGTSKAATATHGHTPVLRTKQWKTHCPRSSHWNISEAADIWSLGCIFFELLTGRFLFEDILPTIQFHMVVSSVMRQASL